MRKLFTRFLCTLALLLMAASPALAQDTGSVTGSVTDAETGEPLPGASVVIVELQQGGAAGPDGNYTIENVTPGEYTIRASFVGYQEAEADVQIEVEAGQTVTQNFEMTPDFTDLEEVVVIGYGERSRRDVTGAVSSVDAEEIANVPTSSPEELLQGRAAGVQLTRNSGIPGSAVEINIRGQSSITAGTQPLFVIDGVPVRSRESASDFGNSNNILQNLSSNDIASIEVLKDASASAIYGSRAANGVVLITTKRGQRRGTDLSVNYYVGSVSATDEFDVLSGPEYVEIYREAGLNRLRDAGVDVSDTDDPFPLFGFPALPTVEDAPDFNTVDDVFRTGLQTQLDLSARGGNESTRFFASGSYFLNESYILGTQFQRINGRLNLDHDLVDWARFGSSIGITRVLNDRPSSGNNVSGVLTSGAIRPPIVPVRTEDGDFNFENPYNIAENTVGAIAVNSAQDFEWFLNGNAFAEVDPFSNLTLRANVGGNVNFVDEYFFNEFRTVDGRPSGARTQNYFEQKRWLLEGTADYTDTFADDHFLNVVLGSSFEWVERNQVFTSASGVASPNLLTVGSAAQPTTTFSDVDRQERLLSYFTRANYTFGDRYIAEFSARVDGSSRFSEDNRFGFFPAGALAWRISSESFMDPVEWVNELKLRVSLGTTGNDQIGTFSYLALFGSGPDGNYAGAGGLDPSQLPNPDLRWEQTTELDIGLDLGLFNNRVFLTADYYDKNTDDLLLDVLLPRSEGFNDFTANIGSVNNTGLELALETQNLTGNFNWSTAINLATNKNEVTELVDQDGDGVGDPIPSPVSSLIRIEEGRPLGSFYLIPYEGVDPETGAPIFTDTNGDGDITSADRQFVGVQAPDWTGGVTNRFGYKGLELSVFFQFESGGKFYNNTLDFLSGLGTFNVSSNILDRWQEPGDQTDVPRLSLFDGNNAARTSTRFLEDGSYLRLKNLRLGYSLPQRFAQRLGVKSAQVYVLGTNLLTFDSIEFGDPEGRGVNGGLTFFTPPQARTFQGGINLTL